MRKIKWILACAIVGSLFSSEAAWTTSASAAAPVLKAGSSGSSVSDLQHELRVLGYFNNSTDTGFFGHVTLSAVRQFQTDQGLKVDGIVGAHTTSALQKAVGQHAVQIGEQFQGVPYVWGGSSPSGFDCSGFVQYVYRRIGIQLPRTAEQMYNFGYSVSQLRPGDLVFFTTASQSISHVGIYTGNGNFISATSSSGVAVRSLSNSYWGARYMGAKRVF